jgi:hypothetical protein
MMENSPIASRAGVCLRDFEQLSSLFESSDRQAQYGISHATVCDGLGRFKIWAANIGAFQSIQASSSLDYRLREVPKVSKQIIDFLEDLSEALEDGEAVPP